MGRLTLLDYEVFDTLKAVLSDESGQTDCAFSEWVLGYGFSSELDGLPSFVLLCHPQATEQLQTLIANKLPDNSLDIEGQPVSVMVYDSVGQLNLSHSIESDPTDESDLPDPDLANHIQVSLGQTLRQVVLQEHRKIILPTYLLRYTPFTSPNLIILRAALSQIHYLHQAGIRGEGEFEQRTVTARMSEISRWSSFSRTSIYRLLHEDPRSQWLVQVENRGSFQNDQGQQISLPNQYLLEPLKLTPGDATDFENYLREHQQEWGDLDECLLALAKTEKRELLSYPYRVPKDDDRTEPAAVIAILGEVYGKFELTSERLTLIDKVRDHLIGDDFVAVPWYLLRRLLPVYGASIVTLYLMCQPLLYKNNGVQRDTFWLPGGNRTLVEWTGDRSVGKYFPKANSKGRGRPTSAAGSSDEAWRKNKRGMLADFFLRVETRKDEAGLPLWQIQVHSMPTLPDDERLMTSIYEYITELIHLDALDSLIDLLDKVTPQQQSVTPANFVDLVYRTPLTPKMSQVLTTLAKAIISDFETPVIKSISNFETPEPRLISVFETPEDNFISKSATPAAAIISEIETYLKILQNIKDSIKEIKQSNVQPDSTQPTPEPIDKSAADWDLAEMLGKVKPEYRSEILGNQQKSQLFKAWLIHSAMNSRVNRPLNLALTQTVRGKSPPDTAARRLADLPKSALTALLEQALDQPEGLGYQTDPELRSQVTDLQLLLVGEDARSRALLLQRLIDMLD